MARKPETIDITRTEAANMIERLRVLACSPPESGLLEALREILRVQPLRNLPPLTKCTGEAHSNPFIDICGQCMPRWGICGPKVRVR